ncbi:M48 family metallopeptidase [Bifidobacterium sp. LC6]|uniref:M48 family metallopeptidase n=1 Tax=Bifidobacterium colobi TaxID=2809026 RepID=A0ABS5UU53_9BIFI|nr:SprT family zinc-dependent metalloprotease [Bifidobacterium colobi]MBT1174335.1 M48 family metallopeptidase [Bifidobacterium colobi]
MPYRPSSRSRSGSHGAVSTSSSLTVDGLSITVVRKPIANMYLRIKPPNGDVVVSAPQRMSERTIIDFVRGRRAWIDGNVRKMQHAREQSVVPQPGLEGGRDGGERTSSGSSETGDSGLVWTDELRQQAVANINAQLPALLAKWGPVIGRTPTHITLRLMTTRWGSCTPKTGRIRLNLQLGLMEPRFLEYVLVHEMTHLWERGHGAGFQRRIGSYLPNWRELRRELNRRVVL